MGWVEWAEGGVIVLCVTSYMSLALESCTCITYSKIHIKS